MTRQRAFDICLTVLIIVGFILLGALVFQKSYLRISECFYDLFVSVKFYSAKYSVSNIPLCRQSRSPLPLWI